MIIVEKMSWKVPLVTSVFVAKSGVSWGHEDLKSPAGLARSTAATRLGAETTGLETNGDRRRLGSHVGSGQPGADPGPRGRGRGRAAGASRLGPPAEAHPRTACSAARPAREWSRGRVL